MGRLINSLESWAVSVYTCLVLNNPFLLTGTDPIMLPPLMMKHLSSLKWASYPDSRRQLIEIMVSLTFEAYNASFRIILLLIGPCGTSTAMSLVLVVLKVQLFAAVIGWFEIGQ